MNIVLSPDSFKGSLTSVQVSNIMKKAIESLGYDDNIIQKPMADGGEGTVDVLLAATNGKKKSLRCTGPLGEKISTYYGIINENIAVIEVANIAGLPDVPKAKRNPNNTTSFGLGEAILDALDNGCKSFIIGLGGSATNDAGLGMLKALGMEAFDKNGDAVGIFGKDLLQAEKICFDKLDPRLKDIQIQVACDVNNPLTGENGASAVYGPQKGLRQDQISIYDEAINRFARLIEGGNTKNSNLPGAGAAGGLGFALLTLNAKIVSGGQLVGEYIGVEDAIKKADLVITGEGQSDEQTLYGKAPGYIADLANRHHVPAILLSGGLKGDLDPLLAKFAGCFSIANRPLTIDESIEKAEELLYQQTKQIINLLHHFGTGGRVPCP